MDWGRNTRALKAKYPAHEVVTKGQYPVLKLSRKALPEAKVIHKVRRQKKAVEGDNKLFELLCQLRKELAQQEKVTPYVIFADSSLKEMSLIMPTDHRSFLKIPGVGEKKLERYGKAFLMVIREFASRQSAFSRQPAYSQQFAAYQETAASQHPEPQFPTGEKEQSTLSTHLVTLPLIQEGKTIAEVAHMRNLKPTTVEDHLIRCGEQGLDVNWSQFIPWQYKSGILETLRKLGSEKLKPIKEALPEEVSYFAIKAVMGKYWLLK